MQNDYEIVVHFFKILNGFSDNDMFEIVSPDFVYTSSFSGERNYQQFKEYFKRSSSFVNTKTHKIEANCDGKFDVDLEIEFIDSTSNQHVGIKGSASVMLNNHLIERVDVDYQLNDAQRSQLSRIRRILDDQS